MSTTTRCDAKDTWDLLVGLSIQLEILWSSERHALDSCCHQNDLGPMGVAMIVVPPRGNEQMMRCERIIYSLPLGGTTIPWHTSHGAIDHSDGLYSKNLQTCVARSLDQLISRLYWTVPPRGPMCLLRHSESSAHCIWHYSIPSHLVTGIYMYIPLIWSQNPCSEYSD